MAIVSEDEAAKTGFSHACVYQVHGGAGAARELKTKAGPLPLEGTSLKGASRGSTRFARASGRAR